MTDHIRRARRGLPAVLLSLVFLVLVAWLAIEIRDVHDRLQRAQRDSQTLAQQVRDLGGVPKVTPQPGPTGAPGSPGAPGQTGRSGQPGAAGRPGQPGASGAPGKTGPSGVPGVAGASGAPGVKGDTGPKGDTGDQGPKGDQGDQGPPGPTCPDGYHTTHTTVVTAGGPQDAVICTAD